MRILSPLRAVLALAVALSALSAPASAQLYVSIGAPPELPIYNQPPLPEANQVWMPGYWAWGSNGYYWVPGTWVTPPYQGSLWTPGYWNSASNGYQWNNGYWAPQVGYYGGVNYGAGYYGTGYSGGYWQGPQFYYNTAVTNVPTGFVRTVYVNRNVIVHNIVRTSYYGGPYGLRVRPTPAQLAVLRMRRVMLTPAQRLHIAEAARDRNLLWRVNHGRPVTVVVRRPLTVNNRPANFRPIAPVRVVHPAAVVHPAPAYHPAAVVHPAPVHHPAPVVHPAPVHHPAPVVHPAPKPPAHPAPKPPPAHPANQPKPENQGNKPPK